MIETIEPPDRRDGKPWVCPKCDRVWGPTVTACAPCNSRGPFGSKRRIMQVALAIERADNEKVPDGYGDGINHPEISDWGVYLAHAAIAALTTTAEDRSERQRNWVTCETCGKVHDRRQSCERATTADDALRDDVELPCDVQLPPATTITKGCKLW